MKPLRFLGVYFKPYMAALFGALIAGLVYALANVLSLAVFQVVLSDVVLTDQSVAEVLSDAATGAEAPEATAGDAAGAPDRAGDRSSDEPAGEASGDVPDDSGLGLEDLDLHEQIMAGYEGLKLSFGVDQESVVFFVPTLLVFVIVLRSIARFVNGYLFQVIGLGATNDLRNDLYERILQQSSRFYGKHPSGELLSRVGNDITVVQNAVSTRFVDFFQQVPTFFGMVWFLISLNAELAGILFLVVCLLYTSPSPRD